MYLKGSAYHFNEMKNFTGRMMSDIDLLVKEKDLPIVENALKKSGWATQNINDYDQKFYRNWAQEIPPLKHIFRQVDLDVHFNILPKTIKESLNGKHLFEQSIPLASDPCEKVLKPHAMLAHSAIHLFYESEYKKGLRDLYDIAIFINDYGDDKFFWQELIKLQEDIGNQQSLYFALRYSQKIYQVKIPKLIQEYFECYKPPSLILKILDFCFIAVFTSMYPHHRKFGYKIPLFILYMRGHLKRMPLRLLLPHLTRKSIDKLKEREESHGFI